MLITCTKLRGGDKIFVLRLHVRYDCYDRAERSFWNWYFRKQTIGQKTWFLSRGVLPYKSDGGARRKISRTLRKGTRILLHGPVPNSFPPLRASTNSTTTNHITFTANFNSNKDNFRTLSSQGPFESIVINLTETTLASVILDFNTLSGTNPSPPIDINVPR